MVMNIVEFKVRESLCQIILHIMTPSEIFCSLESIWASFCCRSASSPRPEKSTLNRAMIESMTWQPWDKEHQITDTTLLLDIKRQITYLFKVANVILLPLPTSNLNTPPSSWNFAATKSNSSIWCSPDDRKWNFHSIIVRSFQLLPLRKADINDK